MRTLLIVCLMASLIHPVWSQNFEPLKPVTVQVSPTMIDYEGLKYGVALGINFKQFLSVNYFHLRDYEYGDNFFDNRYAGLYFNIVIPVFQNLEIGPTARFATMNANWQNLALAGEMRYKFSKSFRMSLEKSVRSDHNFWATKLIFNLY